MADRFVFYPAAASASRLSLVLVTGLEPVRCCHRGILSPLRLPVPPYRHKFTEIVYHAQRRLSIADAD